jgi:hypothetical protein
MAFVIVPPVTFAIRTHLYCVLRLNIHGIFTSYTVITLSGNHHFLVAHSADDMRHTIEAVLGKTRTLHNIRMVQALNGSLVPSLSLLYK